MGKKRLFGIFLILILAIFLISSAFAFSFSDITNFFNNFFNQPQLSPTDLNDPSLMAYYPFDSNANDFCTNPKHGNYFMNVSWNPQPNNGAVSGATLVTGKFGNAYNFN